MTWIKCSDQLPEGGYGKHRKLIMIRCRRGVHKALAWDWAHPCCKANFAYYKGNGQWDWYTNDPIDLEHYTVTHWQDSPDDPEEKYEYEPF